MLVFGRCSVIMVWCSVIICSSKPVLLFVVWSQCCLFKISVIVPHGNHSPSVTKCLAAYVKEFDGLKFICGYLIILCSIILVLINYKTVYASKSLVWVWGVTVFELKNPLRYFTQTTHQAEL